MLNFGTGENGFAISKDTDAKDKGGGLFLISVDAHGGDTDVQLGSVLSPLTIKVLSRCFTEAETPNLNHWGGGSLLINRKNP